MTFDKQALFVTHLDEEDVEISAGIVRIRSLSRDECLSIRGVALEPAALERKMLSMALVDPVLTEDEVSLWQKAGTVGELGSVVDRIIKISGMEVATPKELMQQFREGS